MVKCASQKLRQASGEPAIRAGPGPGLACHPAGAPSRGSAYYARPVTGHHVTPRQPRRGPAAFLAAERGNIQVGG